MAHDARRKTTLAATLSAILAGCSDEKPPYRGVPDIVPPAVAPDTLPVRSDTQPPEEDHIKEAFRSLPEINAPEVFELKLKYWEYLQHREPAEIIAFFKDTFEEAVITGARALSGARDKEAGAKYVNMVSALVSIFQDQSDTTRDGIRDTLLAMRRSLSFPLAKRIAEDMEVLLYLHPLYPGKPLERMPKPLLTERDEGIISHLREQIEHTLKDKNPEQAAEILMSHVTRTLKILKEVDPAVAINILSAVSFPAVAPGEEARVEEARCAQEAQIAIDRIHRQMQDPRFTKDNPRPDHIEAAVHRVLRKQRDVVVVFGQRIAALQEKNTAAIQAEGISENSTEKMYLQVEKSHLKDFQDMAAESQRIIFPSVMRKGVQLGR